MPEGGTGALHELSRAIGSLETGVQNLKEALEKESNAAKQHRESLRSIIDALTEAMRSLTAEVAGVKEDVKEMKPLVEDYEQKRSEARGRAKLGRNIHKIWIGIGGAGLVAGFLTWLTSQHWKWLLLLAVLLGLDAQAFAHDEWISRGRYRNSVGEWCCGEGDCFVVRAQTVSLPAPGYRLPSGEFIPQSEAQPSPDGQFWRCKRPDGTRRCFFAPPPAY